MSTTTPSRPRPSAPRVAGTPVRPGTTALLIGAGVGGLANDGDQAVGAMLPGRP